MPLASPILPAAITWHPHGVHQLRHERQGAELGLHVHVKEAATMAACLYALGYDRVAALSFKPASLADCSCRRKDLRARRSHALHQ
jgi:hypothetical protein